MDKSGLQNERLILIVEDSDDDYYTTLRAFKKDGNLLNPIKRCEDGAEALEYLNDSQDTPAIILLDLNLPGIDGRHVLKNVKSTPKLADIPVVVLTTSDDETDIHECYALGANTYIRKPVNLNAFFKAIQSLQEYWFQVAILPK